MQLRVGTKRIYRGSDWASWSNKLRQPARLFPLLIFPHFFLVFFVRMLEDFQSSCSRSKKKKEKNRNEESSRVGKERERRSVLPIVTKDKEGIKEEGRKKKKRVKERVIHTCLRSSFERFYVIFSHSCVKLCVYSREPVNGGPMIII